ncbi:hypothetical protein AC96_5173 [Escherichia coli 2-156-04_S4_C2]|nr:hypothetical protein AC96_5173 [Escherichia coli 2-156-04_S4_C2]
MAENSGEDAQILFREQTLFPLFSFFYRITVSESIVMH